MLPSARSTSPLAGEGSSHRPMRPGCGGLPAATDPSSGADFVRGHLLPQGEEAAGRRGSSGLDPIILLHRTSGFATGVRLFPKITRRFQNAVLRAAVPHGLSRVL